MMSDRFGGNASLNDWCGKNFYGAHSVNFVNFAPIAAPNRAPV